MDREAYLEYLDHIHMGCPVCLGQSIIEAKKREWGLNDPGNEEEDA